MTISIGFRAPDEAALARGMLEAAADQIIARSGFASGPYGEPPLPGPALDKLYRDPSQPAVAHPAEIPDRLRDAAVRAAGKIKFDEALATRFLGCWLTEPNQAAVFDNHASAEGWDDDTPYTHWALDRRTRMLYRDQQLFINGEAASVRAEAGLRLLADERELAGDCAAAKRLSSEAREALADWLDDGWIKLVRKP
jgi:50S ribosomal protein L16 3-hydroxylase